MSTAEPLQAPFPYFGGKSKVADIVWEHFGDVSNYVEPFFGSGAVLLRRPDWHENTMETVNDNDCYVANFWRAMQREPDTLADICDNPVNEADLEAWHKWLVTASRKASLELRCKSDPDYYDAKIAGRWCWGLCQWIGRGWCCGEWNGEGSDDNFGEGINVRDPDRGGKLPHLGDNGRGVHRQLPHLGNNGVGVHKQRPHLGDNGRGVHRQLPHLGNNGRGVHPCSNWFEALAERLRRVRVCCGDWERVTGPSVTFTHGRTGVFLDPPYADTAGRDESIYKEESLSVAHDVREWAIEAGKNKLMRICLCGYEGEHEMPDDWQCVSWKAHGGYGVQNGNGEYVNKFRERLWFSPACEKPRMLFS